MCFGGKSAGSSSQNYDLQSWKGRLSFEFEYLGLLVGRKAARIRKSWLKPTLVESALDSLSTTTIPTLMKRQRIIKNTAQNIDIER